MKTIILCAICFAGGFYLSGDISSDWKGEAGRLSEKATKAVKSAEDLQEEMQYKVEKLGKEIEGLHSKLQKCWKEKGE